jgi:hypothetical protein
MNQMGATMSPTPAAIATSNEISSTAPATINQYKMAPMIPT